ncbi:MAG: helix-turn-helix transcriptional regulator, partial [Kiritimatiellae bacterium]|nr:helix-turn-helix transcriptional regulator [Kiritimatiellia bacterium]
MAKESKAGERVRTYRERLDMSIYDLSQKSGISEDVINSIEKGEVLPALGVLTKLSRALGQRLGTFMDDQFKPDPIIT